MPKKIKSTFSNQIAKHQSNLGLGGSSFGKKTEAPKSGKQKKKKSFSEALCD
jgi:hypothetical protein